MTTHHPKFSIHTALQLVGLTTEKLLPTALYWCHFHIHISHKAGKSMAKLSNQSCGELQPAVCFPRGYAAILRQPERSWMSDKVQKQATLKASWATFSINTWLNC